MENATDCRIEIEAATALLAWKSMFADEVATLGRQLATQAGRPQRVTLADYREAARTALRSLGAAISDGESSHGDDKAA